MHPSTRAFVVGGAAPGRESSSLLLSDPPWSARRSETGSGSTLLRAIEIDLLDGHRVRVLRRQLEVMLEQLDVGQDRLLQEQAGSQATLPAHRAALSYLQDVAGFSKGRAAQLVGITRQTIHNWENGGPIAATKRAHLLAVRDVIERAALRYTTPEELAVWLDTPRGADGRTPAQLLAEQAFDRARLLAVATPVPATRGRPAEWANRPVPPAFERGAEHDPAAEPPEPRDLAPEADEEPDEYRPAIIVEDP